MKKRAKNKWQLTVEQIDRIEVELGLELREVSVGISYTFEKVKYNTMFDVFEDWTAVYTMIDGEKYNQTIDNSDIIKLGKIFVGEK